MEFIQQLLMFQPNDVKLTSKILQESQHWEFLKQVEVIILEKFLIIQRSVFKCAQHPMQSMHLEAKHSLFGLVLLIAIGNFQQVALVIS